MINYGKIGLVIQREYITRVAKKSFILITLLAPVVFVLIATIPILLSQMDTGEQQVVAVIDRTGQYAPLLEDTEQYRFVVADKSANEYRSAGGEQEITAVLEITEDLGVSPKAINLFSFKTLPTGLERHINSLLSTYVTDQKIASHNIPELKEIIRTSKVEIVANTYKWSEDGAESVSSGAASSVIGLLLSFVSYMFIMLYGGMIIQSVIEEKKSRIVEVMVSSVRPFELMMGKIVGIGLVGLTQIFIWVVALIGIGLAAQFFLIGDLYSPEALAAAQGSGSLSASELQAASDIFGVMQGINFFQMIVFFVLFFIGGYLLYASVLAALGSSVSSDEDAGQLMLPVTMIMVFSLYVGMAAAENPEGNLAFWTSLIPFTSPIVMMSRLAYDVPLWEQILSLVLLFGLSILLTYFGAKIYRVGILMYGKKPSLKELWRWMNYK